MDKVQSFRFDADIMNKLDQIKSYHQLLIENTSNLIQANSLTLSRAAVIKGLIEKEFSEMVREGLIEE